jgi:hypothetical protein
MTHIALMPNTCEHITPSPDSHTLYNSSISNHLACYLVTLISTEYIKGLLTNKVKLFYTFPRDKIASYLLYFSLNKEIIF